MPSATASRDAAAPVKSKIIPAYAHSFARERRGATIAIAPSTFHVPSTLMIVQRVSEPSHVASHVLQAEQVCQA